MKAVTSAGKPRDAMAGLVLVSGLSPHPALAGSHVDRVEQLMREQQALQASQFLQIQSLRQQIDQQALDNRTNDWQLASGLTLALLIVLIGAWLMARLPQWRQRRQVRGERLRVLAANTEKQPLPQKQLVTAFASSGWQGGADIDHSGQGIVKRMLRQKKYSRRLDAPVPDFEWLAQLDEQDSQSLADDALREYELRRTVGLTNAVDDDAQSAETKRRQTKSVDDVWQSMEEVPLEKALDSDMVQAEEAKPHAANLDVSLEVQRVRKALLKRRKMRDLTAPMATENKVPEGERNLDFEAPIKQTDRPNNTLTEPAEGMRSSHEPRNEPETTDRYSPSVRTMSDAETRLALAHEFEKLGAIDEAAQLCEEVLASGSPEEQSKAQRFLRHLPGR